MSQPNKVPGGGSRRTSANNPEGPPPPATTSAEDAPKPTNIPPRRGSVNVTIKRESNASGNGKRGSGATSSFSVAGDEIPGGVQRSNNSPMNFKPTRYKSMLIDQLPQCRTYRTRESLDDLQNPIDQPKPTTKYHPPFRRNFRYFGYPQNLNLEINTPPRVKSWGSVELPVLKSEKHKVLRRGPSKFKASAMPDATFDPHWMGRLLKRNLLLENPGLLPPTDRAQITSLQLVHPEFLVHNCPSDLYFPLSDSGRLAFCKINKHMQDKIDRHVKAYQIQNPTVMKYVNLEPVMKKFEPDNPQEVEQESVTEKRRQTVRHSVVPGMESMWNSEAAMVYDYTLDVPNMGPVMKTMCAPKNWPGLNRQLYERPREHKEAKGVVDREEDKLVYGGPIVPSFKLNIPEDIWTKLAKVRQRQKEMEKNLQKRLNLDQDAGKFRTFTQAELRDEVMTRAREDFMLSLKEDLDAPLPPELFRDNRMYYQPQHDFEEQGELPPQGPFWWKERREDEPTKEELQIVDNFLGQAKLRHSYTHHLPGLVHLSRHPYPVLELDWLEKGAEMNEVREARKTPDNIQDMPAFMQGLDKERFRKKFGTAVKEGAKELVGKEMWDYYKRMYGVVEEEEKREEGEEGEQEEKQVRRVKRRRVKKKPSREEVLEEAQVELGGEGEDEMEEEDEEEEGEVEEETVEAKQEVKMSVPELEPEYKLSQDLQEDPEFPLQSVSFDDIEFPPLDELPEECKKVFKAFNKNLLSGEPVTKEQEELIEKEDDSPGTTDSEEEMREEDKDPKVSHDAVPHLQEMYQSAVMQKMKRKSAYGFKPVDMKELEPPKLKDVFLKETYVEDIDNILKKNSNLPAFLQTQNF